MGLENANAHAFSQTDINKREGGRGVKEQAHEEERRRHVQERRGVMNKSMRKKEDAMFKSEKRRRGITSMSVR